MNKTQIKKLVAKLGVDAVVSGRGANWEIECADRKASVVVKRALRLAKVYCGGYKAGWGGWVYDTVNRSSYAYTCDFGDKASVHHY
jgi:hypothetical protein